MTVLDNALQQSMKDQTKSKIVWENASPASTMGAQTIPIDLSGWDDVEIVPGNNENKAQSIILSIGDSANVYTNGVDIYRRRYTVTENGVTIAAGYQLNTVDNNAAKPFIIYARKIIGGGRAIVNMLCHLFSMERRCAAWQF